MVLSERSGARGKGRSRLAAKVREVPVDVVGPPARRDDIRAGQSTYATIKSTGLADA
jgi:hypothetical protein